MDWTAAVVFVPDHGECNNSDGGNANITQTTVKNTGKLKLPFKLSLRDKVRSSDIRGVARGGVTVWATQTTVENTGKSKCPLKLSLRDKARSSDIQGVARGGVTAPLHQEEPV